MTRWPVRDGLLAYRAQLKDRVAEDFYRATLIWALLAPHQKHPEPAPKRPALLDRD